MIKKSTKKAAAAALLCLLIAGMCWLVRSDRLNLQTILDFTPKNYLAAALVLIVLYAIKSVTFFFPLMALQIAAGVIFPTSLAILVNILGCMVQVSCPYFMGVYMGRETIEEIENKYPKAKQITALFHGNEFFFSYFIRILGVLPADVVSMMMGAMGITYRKYLPGTVLGMLPGLIAATLMGLSIDNPKSPMFIGSVAFDVLLAIASAVMYRLLLCKKKKT